MISGCASALWRSPQVATGGINSTAAEEYPNYSPDGRYLAFASDRRGHRDIFMYDLEQKTLINLPNLNRRDSSQDQPSLSNDGRYIAYISNERGKLDVMVYDRISQQSKLLSLNLRGSVRHPTINGDGSKIAFQTSQAGQWQIMIVETGF
ncbi:MAG: biopolymer transporter [Cyanobacteria bacterium J083]|nr:MAG: biopolymer transporter [Cyanobacteria bacterium J083]